MWLTPTKNANISNKKRVSFLTSLTAEWYVNSIESFFCVCSTDMDFIGLSQSFGYILHTALEFFIILV